MSIENREAGDVQYRTPEESQEEGGERFHTFTIKTHGETVSSAELEYLSKPLPHYNLKDLYTIPQSHGQGFASKILTDVEKFLLDKGKPGVLVDAIFSDSPAFGMYERRGWKKVPGSQGLYVFNWPQSVPLEALQGYSDRYTDYNYRLNSK